MAEVEGRSHTISQRNDTWSWRIKWSATNGTTVNQEETFAEESGNRVLSESPAGAVTNKPVIGHMTTVGGGWLSPAATQGMGCVGDSCVGLSSAVGGRASPGGNNTEIYTY
eukprot:9839442-Karenia_brevis.AAC.1